MAFTKMSAATATIDCQLGEARARPEPREGSRP